MSDQTSYLSVCQAQHGSQLLPVRLGDILLDLEPLLQPFPLQVREHGPGPRPLPLVRLRHGVFGENGIWACEMQEDEGERLLQFIGLLIYLLVGRFNCKSFTQKYEHKNRGCKKNRSYG